MAATTHNQISVTQGSNRTVHARNAPNITKINISHTSLTLKIFAEIDFCTLCGGITRRGGRFVAHLRDDDEVAFAKMARDRERARKLRRRR